MSPVQKCSPSPLHWPSLLQPVRTQSNGVSPDSFRAVHPTSSIKAGGGGGNGCVYVSVSECVCVCVYWGKMENKTLEENTVNRNPILFVQREKVSNSLLRCYLKREMSAEAQRPVHVIHTVYGYMEKTWRQANPVWCVNKVQATRFYIVPVS